MYGTIPRLLQYVLMTFYLVKHKDNFIFYLHLYLMSDFCKVFLPSLSGLTQEASDLTISL